MVISTKIVRFDNFTSILVYFGLQRPKGKCQNCTVQYLWNNYNFCNFQLNIYDVELCDFFSQLTNHALKIILLSRIIYVYIFFNEETLCRSFLVQIEEVNSGKLGVLLKIFWFINIFNSRNALCGFSHTQSLSIFQITLQRSKKLGQMIFHDFHQTSLNDLKSFNHFCQRRFLITQQMMLLVRLKNLC